MSAADNGTPAAAASEAAVAPSAAESVAPIAVPLPVAAPTSATATGAAAAASPATSATPVPVVRQPTMRKPAVSARMQRLSQSRVAAEQQQQAIARPSPLRASLLTRHFRVCLSSPSSSSRVQRRPSGRLLQQDDPLVARARRAQPRPDDGALPPDAHHRPGQRGQHANGDQQLHRDATVPRRTQCQSDVPAHQGVVAARPRAHSGHHNVLHNLLSRLFNFSFGAAD